MPEFTEKTAISELRKHLKDNKLEDLFKERHGKAAGKSTKKEILSFLKEQNLANDVDNIISDAILDSSFSSHSKTESSDKNDENTLIGNTVNLDELHQVRDIYFEKSTEEKDPDGIEEIPIFKQEQRAKQEEATQKNSDNIKEKYDLNTNQKKVLKYITRFPEKLKVITSRPTFKQEFATLRDYNPDQNEEENLANEKLRHEIEQTLNGANIGALVLDQIFVTVDAIETIIVAIRENKNGKIPQYIVDTVGQVRIEGLSEVLQKNPNFHDCIDELLIKYDSYDGLLKYLSVETRLMLIILGSAYLVHKGNVKKEALKQESESERGHAKMRNVNVKFKDL